MRQHCQEAANPDVKNAARECFQTFQKPPFITRALAVFADHLHDLSLNAIAFICLLGDTAVVPGLLDLYLKCRKHAEQDILLGVLGNFKEAVVADAHRRLNGAGLEGVRLLLRVIGNYGAEDPAAALRELLEHEAHSVRQEAFAALLILRDQWAIGSLRSLLESDDWAARSGAIAMVGKCRLQEFVPDLVAMLTMPSLFQTNMEQNEMLVRTLGEIGDPEALPVLEKIVSKGFSFFSKDLQQLKQAVFDSLEGYPVTNLAGLLDFGVKSNDKGIRVACQRVVINGMWRSQ